MNKTKVSIIVPVFNMEAYIQRCIDSIVGQTYQHLEIILINDRSVDSISIIVEILSTTG
ncbi:MAG: glycosyltransferase family 2 protein [Bacteroidetes bacterium]|nr:glycosyltransferase family 2 protein [Bacteroidota bacterium]